VLIWKRKSISSPLPNVESPPTSKFNSKPLGSWSLSPKSFVEPSLALTGYPLSGGERSFGVTWPAFETKSALLASEGRKPKRGQHRVNESLEGRSERPTVRGMGSPEPLGRRHRTHNRPSRRSIHVVPSRWPTVCRGRAAMRSSAALKPGNPSSEALPKRAASPEALGCVPTWKTFRRGRQRKNGSRADPVQAAEKARPDTVNSRITRRIDAAGTATVSCASAAPGRRSR